MTIGVHRHKSSFSDNEHECAETIAISEKIDHPRYDGAQLTNDISLLRLSQPPTCCTTLPLSTHPPHHLRPLHSRPSSVLSAQAASQPQARRCLASITLPTLDDGSHSQGGEAAVVAGWGHTSEGGSSPGEMHSVELTLITNAICEDGDYGHSSGSLEESMLCAAGDSSGGEDACNGDSGEY